MNSVVSFYRSVKPPFSPWWRILLVLAAVALAYGVTFVWPERNGYGIEIDSSPRAQAARKRLPYDLSKLSVLNRVIHHVNKYYVAPERVEYREMLLAGLNAIQLAVPPVIVHHKKGARDLSVIVDTEEKRFPISDVTSPWTLAQRFREVFAFLQKHLDEEDIELRDVEYASVNGALRTLDPHSTLLTPEVYTEMRMSTRGEFGGLGIVISIRDGLLTVIRPMPGTPAEKSGLKRHDRIVGIDNESTLNMPLQEAVDRLRGAPGSKVNISIVRETPKGWSDPRTVQLERAIIHIDSVESRVLDGNIGYVQLKSFQGNTTSDLERALRKLDASHIKGLILDLQDNPGGLLEQAIRVTDIFLKSGTIVSTRSNDESQRDEKHASNDGNEPTYPLVVLVNGGSASASEIVAGALKNHDRALVIGQRTFGKGSVQVLYDYNDGSALKLTIAQYLTPGDVSIQGTGIVPDIGIDPITVDRDDMDLTVNRPGLREADLERHLTNESVRQGDKPEVLLEYYLPEEIRERLRETNEGAQEENEHEAQFLIRFAERILSQATHADRRRLLADAKKVIATTQAQELDRAISELRKLGIDWSKGPDKGPSDLSVEVSTNRPNNSGRAGEPFELIVQVTNRGQVPIYRLRATTSSDFLLFDQRELVFGKLKPGQTRRWSATLGLCETRNPKPAVTVGKDGQADPWRALLPQIGRAKGKPVCTLPFFLADRADGIRVDFQEAYGHTPKSAEIRTTVTSLPKPQFAYSLQIADPKGNGDGTIQRGETATLFLHVKNVGKGPSYTTQANLRNLTGNGVLLRDGRFRIDDIKPGQERTVPFTFKILPDAEDSEAKFEVSVADTDLREGVTEKVSVWAKSTSGNPKPVNGTAYLAAGTPILESPHATSKAIAYASKGILALPMEATLGEFTRVTMAAGQPGWVNAGKLEKQKPASTDGVLANALNHMPPELSLDYKNQHVTSSPTLKLSGTARDRDQVKDVYIFVGARKVFYKSNRAGKNPKAVSFSTLLPLSPGTNHINVFARKRNDMVTRASFIVRRDGKDGTLLKTPTTDEMAFGQDYFEPEP